jgi:mRNA interferase YafQ
MLELKQTDRFRKDLKRALKRGFPMDLLNEVIGTLREQNTLAAKYRDYALAGDYTGFRECHIQPDWLLIYAVNDKDMVLVVSRTGTHSDLF